METSMLIGTVQVKYSEDGEIIPTDSFFNPQMKIHVGKDQGVDFRKIKISDNEEALKQNADLLFASWFSKMNEIELADRNEWKIVSTIKRCDTYPTGSIKLCLIEYSFEKINSKKS